MQRSWGTALTGGMLAWSVQAAEVHERGRELAQVHCSQCHAVGREGASPMTGAVPFRELELLYPIETLAEALAEGIVTGHPQMPVFTFTPAEIDELLAYLDDLR